LKAGGISTSTTKTSGCLRFDANEKEPESGVGTQPEGGLPPGAALAHTNHESNGSCMAACIDFVQFDNGDTWYSRHPDSLATEAGVDAGRRAAATHLKGVLDRSGVAAVMRLLPRIHVEVMEPSATRIDGPSGFYSGVTNLVLRVQHVFNREGHDGVRHYSGQPPRGTERLTTACRRRQPGRS
jgi:hypothetical protein